MNSRVLAAIAAAVLALGGIGAVVFYAAGAQNRAYDGATLVSVYRTTADVSANATAEEVGNAVEEVRLPNAAIPKGAVRELADIQGQKTTVPLVAGEILVTGRFDEGGSSSASGSTVPKGLQEITVPLGLDTSASAASGQKVGIIVSGETPDGDPVARMIAQNVLVTSVVEAGDGRLVTFAANGALSTQIAAAATYGQIRLTLQNDDTASDGGKSVNAKSLVK